MNNLLSKVKHVPHTAGVYLFMDHPGQVIYVGKAIDLKRRIQSYFAKENSAELKPMHLLADIFDIKYIQTASEFDAILLEAKLIRKYSPKYNIISKDDKSPIYIHMTFSELMPRILFVRQKRLDQVDHQDKIIGPFQSARVVRHLMTSIRKTIPFCTQKNRNGKTCFYTHLGLCNPCPSLITNMEDSIFKKRLVSLYRRNLCNIARILEGKSRLVISVLESQMNQAAEKNDFETAAKIKLQVSSLYSLHVRYHDPSVYENYGFPAAAIEELAELRKNLISYYPTINILKRIECIDISNLGGTYAAGSLVVLESGLPNKSEYRRFKIRLIKSQNDAAMIAEVLTRRLNHTDWQKPDLLIVDGGKPQLSSALSVLNNIKLNIPLIGLAKRFEEVIIPSHRGFTTLRIPLNNPALHIIQRVRDEAHRFAKSYHVWLRETLNKPTLGVNRIKNFPVS